MQDAIKEIIRLFEDNGHIITASTVFDGGFSMECDRICFEDVEMLNILLRDYCLTLEICSCMKDPYCKEPKNLLVIFKKCKEGTNV